MALTNMVDKNKSFFTYQQYKRAKKARELCFALRTLLVPDFKSLTQSNTSVNNPIATENIKIAEQTLDQTLDVFKEQVSLLANTEG